MSNYRQNRAQGDPGTQFRALKGSEQMKIFLNGGPLFGRTLYRPKELRSAEQIRQLRFLSYFTRNFKNTSLRTAFRKLGKIDDDVFWAFALSWTKLRFLERTKVELRPVLYELLRGMWNIDFQIKYQDLLETLPQSSNFFRARVLKESLYKDDTSFRTIASVYMGVPLEWWIPESIFPVIYYRKESKLSYSMEPLNLSDEKLSVFRERVKQLIKSIGLKELFCPPSECLPNADLRLYNDGGITRRDWEQPQTSTSCGFLLQVFNPRPLGTREVWLPDYSTKLSNSFWMTVGRQFLTNTSWYPREDPLDTYEAIKDRISRAFFGYFDISAFGLQYPRVLLLIVAEEIHHYYPNVELSEQVEILKRLLNRKIPLQVSPGKFVYPVRGIGLGYYEDLKTLGIMAILMPWHSDVISLYGDQALISLFRKSNMRKFLYTLIDELRSFNFIIKDDKVDMKTGVVKWSGWTMGTIRYNAVPVERRGRVATELLTVLDGRYHWERKLRIRSFYTNHQHMKQELKWFPSFYEGIYGYEFRPKDSFNSYLQCGVAPHERRELGLTPFFRVERLISPKDKITDNLVYSTPLFMEWRASEAHRFDKYRKAIYKTTRGSSEVFEYCNPIIELHNTVKFRPNALQRSVSDRMELRLIALYGACTGKFTYGTDISHAHSILRRYSLASNPFEAHATGGYRVHTRWHHPRRVSAEWLAIVDHLSRTDGLTPMFAKYYSEGMREYDRVQAQIKKTALKRIPYPSWGNPQGDPNRSSKKLRLDPERARISLDSFRLQDRVDHTLSSNISSASDLITDFAARFNDEDIALYHEDGGELEDVYLSNEEVDYDLLDEVEEVNEEW